MGASAAAAAAAACACTSAEGGDGEPSAAGRAEDITESTATSACVASQIAWCTDSMRACGRTLYDAPAGRRRWLPRHRSSGTDT